MLTSRPGRRARAARSLRMRSGGHVCQTVCAGKRASKCGDLRVTSDHEGDGRTAEGRGDPPPFTPEQMAWLEEYRRPPASGRGAVAPGTAPPTPRVLPTEGPGARLVTAASVAGEYQFAWPRFQLVACSATVPVVGQDGGGHGSGPLTPRAAREQCRSRRGRLCVRTAGRGCLTQPLPLPPPFPHLQVRHRPLPWGQGVCRFFRAPGCRQRHQCLPAAAAGVQSRGRA